MLEVIKSDPLLIAYHKYDYWLMEDYAVVVYDQEDRLATGMRIHYPASSEKIEVTSYLRSKLIRSGWGITSVKRNAYNQFIAYIPGRPDEPMNLIPFIEKYLFPANRGWVEADTPFMKGDEIRVEYTGDSGFCYAYEGRVSAHGERDDREVLVLEGEDIEHYLTPKHRFYKRSN